MSLTELHNEFLGDTEYRAAYAEEDLIHRIALRVLQLRQRRNLSQEELAERLGTKQPAIAKLEGGYANPSARRLARIAFALDCRPEDLVDCKDPVVLRPGWERSDPKTPVPERCTVVSMVELTKRDAATAGSDLEQGLVGVA